MSYGSNSPRPKRGGGLVFVIILAIGAFLLFSNQGGEENPGVRSESGGQSSAPEDILGTNDYEQEQLRKDILGAGSGGDFEGKKMPSGGIASAGDWEMDDVATKPNPSGQKQPQQTQSGKSSKTTNGDWAIEDVDGKKKTESQFQFSDKKGGTNLNPPISNGGGDWSIDDVNKPKKTENGDWAIEETNTSNNKKK